MAHLNFVFDNIANDHAKLAKLVDGIKKLCKSFGHADTFTLYLTGPVDEADFTMKRILTGTDKSSIEISRLDYATTQRNLELKARKSSFAATVDSIPVKLIEEDTISISPAVPPLAATIPPLHATYIISPVSPYNPAGKSALKGSLIPGTATLQLSLEEVGELISGYFSEDKEMRKTAGYKEPFPAKNFSDFIRDKIKTTETVGGVQVNVTGIVLGSPESGVMTLASGDRNTAVADFLLTHIQAAKNIKPQTPYNFLFLVSSRGKIDAGNETVFPEHYNIQKGMIGLFQSIQANPSEVAIAKAIGNAGNQKVK